MFVKSLFAALLTVLVLLGSSPATTPPAEIQAPPEPVSQRVSTETPLPQLQVTADDAREIALNHAGLRLAQVTRLRVEKDREDGIWIYEVEFRQGTVEYEYEIHSQTGKILKWEKDFD